MRMRGDLLLRRAWLTWALVRVYGILTLSVHGLVDDDLDLYAGWARRWAGGEQPYADFDLEYPPGLLPFLWLPSADDLNYRIAFVALALAADAAVLALLRRSSGPAGSGLWLVMPVLLGPVVWCRTDVFVALFLVLAVHALRRGSTALSAVSLVAASSLKLWPAVLLVLALPLVRPGSRSRFVCAGVTAAVVAALLPVAAYGTDGLVRMLRYHADRGLQVEALAAAPLHGARLAGVDLEVKHQFGSLEFPPESVRWLLFGLTGLLVLGLVRCALLACTTWARADLAVALLPVVLVVASTGKILSAQYAVWIVAAVALLVDRIARPQRLLAPAAAFLITTQYVYPFTFGGLLGGERVSLVAAVVHGAATAWLCLVGLSAAGFWRRGSRLPSEESPWTPPTDAPSPMPAPAGLG